MISQKILSDIIKFDITELVELGLNPNQYTFLAVFYSQGYKVAKSFITLTQRELNELLEKEYIKTDIFNSVVIGKKALDLFEVTDFDKMFEELYTLFPRKVPDGRGGYRILRSEALDSKDAEVCKKKYKKILGRNKELHKQIMQALKQELALRKGPNMQYMKGLEAWLNDRIFEKYFGLDITDPQEKTKSI